MKDHLIAVLLTAAVGFLVVFVSIAIVHVVACLLPGGCI
jgi:hypothetical protein